MNETIGTADPDEIQNWVEQHGGEPAVSEGNPRELRIDFGEESDIKEISWKEFIEI